MPVRRSRIAARPNVSRGARQTNAAEGTKPNESQPVGADVADSEKNTTESGQGFLPVSA